MKSSRTLLPARCLKKKKQTSYSPCVVCHSHETIAEHAPNKEHILKQPHNDVQLNEPNQKTHLQECTKISCVEGSHLMRFPNQQIKAPIPP